MPTVHQRHGRTDGRTDGRTSYDSNTALTMYHVLLGLVDLELSAVSVSKLAPGSTVGRQRNRRENRI